MAKAVRVAEFEDHIEHMLLEIRVSVEIKEKL